MVLGGRQRRQRCWTLRVEDREAYERKRFSLLHEIAGWLHSSLALCWALEYEAAGWSFAVHLIIIATCIVLCLVFMYREKKRPRESHCL